MYLCTYMYKHTCKAYKFQHTNTHQNIHHQDLYALTNLSEPSLVFLNCSAFCLRTSAHAVQIRSPESKSAYRSSGLCSHCVCMYVYVYVFVCVMLDNTLYFQV
jgi:hypothetical protein